MLKKIYHFLHTITFPLENNHSISQPKDQFQVKSSKILTINLLSILFMGITGLAMNSLILIIYDVNHLGVFNQTLSIYIIISQIASMGIHFSILKETAAIDNSIGNFEKNSINIISAIIATSLSASLTAIILFLIAPAISNLFQSPNLQNSLKIAALSLFFYALNKTLINVINGKNLMLEYGKLQLLRYASLLFFFLILTYIKINPDYLFLSFLFTELILLFTSIFILKNYQYLNFTFTNLIEIKSSIRKHLGFGLKGFSSGLLIELNSRVGILSLGIFCSDSVVGKYSLCSFFIEGTTQVYTLLRNFNAPKLAQMLHEKSYLQIKAFFKIYAIKQRFFSFFFSLSIILLFILYGHLYLSSKDFIFKELFITLTILLFGQIINSPFYAFDNIFILTGLPGQHSIFLTISCGLNFLFNLFFIPFFQSIETPEIYAASIGTSISIIISIIIYKYTVNNKLGLNLN